MFHLLLILLLLLIPSNAQGAIDLREEGTSQGFVWALDVTGCSTASESAAVGTIDFSGCGGGTGDQVTVNSTAVDTTADFADDIYTEWTHTDGGAGGPDTVNAKPDYDQTLAGNPALEVDECIPFKDTSGGGTLCEGSTADTNEQLYRYPDVNGADTTEYYVMADDANVSSTEAGYLDGVTSAIQTQLDGKEGTLTNEAGLYSALSDVSDFTQPGVAETISANWVNTANPWADNEVADDITASNYLPLSGGTLTGEATVDDLGLEFTAGDSLTDCSTFSATGGGIFYDDSEGKFKKCQDNTLTDLDTGGADTNSPKLYYWPASATLPLQPIADLATGAEDGVAPITKDTDTNLEILGVAFDDTADEFRAVTFKVPSDVATGVAVSIGFAGYAATAALQDVALIFAHYCVADGEDWDGNVTEEALTATLTNTQDAKDFIIKSDETAATSLGWAANDTCFAYIGRDGDHATDDGLTGDFILTEFWIEIPRA